METKTLKVRKYIHFSDRTLKKAIQGMVLSSYGVAGLAHKNILTIDSKKVSKSNPLDSIELIKNARTKAYTINVYLFLTTGIKITEVLSEIQKRINYELRKVYGIKISSTNIFCQALIDNGK